MNSSIHSLFEAIESAYTLLKSYIWETPVEYSPWLSEETGAEVWLKLEHLQHTGSFKLRGALNKVMSLSEEEKRRGVITASTGNHAAAVAYALQQTKVKGTIFLPENVAKGKKEYLAQYKDVELSYFGTDAIETELKAKETAQQEGRVFISPYNDFDVIAGQGTVGVELYKQIADLDTVFVPVGGGGLVSGIAAYLKQQQPKIEIIGVQPENSPVMQRSVEAGSILDMESTATLSDGTAGGIEPDAITFSYCQALVDRFILLSEEEIRQAICFLLEKHYYLVEGAAALSVAALRKGKKSFEGKKVALVLCGRKLGIDTLREVLGN